MADWSLVTLGVAAAVGLYFVVTGRWGILRQARSIFVRPLSSAAAMDGHPKPIQVSEHLSLQHSTVTSTSGQPRPLVLFFPWLYATPRAQAHYMKLYLGRGLDVLSVRCQLHNFLWPNSCHTLARHLLDYLGTNEADRYLVHGVSIGAFVYTVVMLEMRDNPQKYGTLQNKIVGQVFDSLTMGSLDRMANGIANKNKGALTRFLITSGVHTYFYLTKKHTVDFYDSSVAAFKSMMVKTPVLLFFSLDDPMLSAEDMEAMISDWKAMKDPRVEVHVKCWERSKHAQHSRMHPEQYEMALQAFLIKLGLETLGAKL